MQFGVLGPSQVIADNGDKPGALLTARLRTLLAVLLWRANQPVRVDELAELVWDGAPPSGAAGANRALILRLRRQLGPQIAARIKACAPGYAIELSSDELDAIRFEMLTKEAGAAARARRWTQAADNASRALALWRGKPLIDVQSQLLRDQWVPHLEQLHVQALEWRIEADLHEGRHEQLTSELQSLTAQFPLREHFHEQLMLALYRGGRQGEALAAYQHARDVLITELGVEPGPGLQNLQQKILAGDPALVAFEPAEPEQAGTERAVPRELPPTVPGFTGRAAELRALSGLLDKPGERPPGTVVISGTAGVGKTSLAVCWGQQVADRFPDGQLYVNLRGYDPDQPMSAADALASFLRSLGVPGQVIPPEEEQRAALYRTVLATKQMLVLLDNARDEHQVRPLLPGALASLVIVTSRNQLTGLAAAHGARVLSLDVLAHDEALRLLTARIGGRRVAAEPGAADEISALCAYLPLALAIAAARAAARPSFTLAVLAAELRDSASLLDVLDAGDPAASVRAVFSLSYQQLSSEAARMFRLLGLHPGPDISARAAASLVAADESCVRRLLGELTRNCLITEHAPGRYAFHDLLRAYAASRARTHDSETDRARAISRIVDHYLHTARHSRKLLRRPEQETLNLTPPSAGTRPERPADLRQAMAWFTAEHHVLLAASTMAAETGTDRRAWQLPCAMADYFRKSGYPQERVTVMTSALAAADRLGDTVGRAMSLRRLGGAWYSTGDYDQARTQLEQCIPLYRQLGDRLGEALAQQNLGYVAEAQGRTAEALGHSEEARDLLQAAGHELAEAEALGNSGWYHAILGDYERARALCEQALAVIAKHEGRSSEHAILSTLGYIEHQLGNVTQAAAHYETAITLSRDISDAPLEAEILNDLGDLRHTAGQIPQARKAWQQALAIYDDLHHPNACKVRAKLVSTHNCP